MSISTSGRPTSPASPASMANRVGKGLPTGGQFAASARTESEVTLGGTDEANPLTARQVEANANSKVLQIEAIAADRAKPGPEQMVAIARLTDSFHDAVDGAADDPFRTAAAEPTYGAMTRSAISPHQIISNANSKVLQVEAIVADRTTPTPERMVAIARLADSFRDAVRGATHDPFRG